MSDGTIGSRNEEGIQYYKNLTKALRAEGITPMVTLYHWDLPQALQDKGGWMNESIVEWFKDYAELCFKEFGNDVGLWITFNEPWIVAYLGYGVASFPPQIYSPGTGVYIATHHILLAHAEAYRSFKKIGKPGASSFGSVFRSTDDDESVKVLVHALKSGVNLIDTAPWYGQGKSETVLGKGLQKIPRQSYYVNTKVGRYELEPENMFDFRAERVISSVDESLARLGLEYVDVIQVHDMEFAPSLDIIIDETLPALQKVVDAGKAKFIGITGYPLENFRTVITRSKVKVDTVLTYCRGCMNDNALQDYVPYFKENNIGVINASPIAMGLLSERGPPAWHPATDDIKDACQKAAAYCKENNVDISRLATNFTVNQPGIATTLVSTASLTNIKKNLHAVTVPLTAGERKILDDVIEKFMKPLNNKNWEGLDVDKYWAQIKQRQEKDNK